MSSSTEPNVEEAGRKKYEEAYATSNKNQVVESNVEIPGWSGILSSIKRKQHLYKIISNYKLSDILHILLSFKSKCDELGCNPCKTAP